MKRLALAVAVAAALIIYTALHGPHLARVAAPIDVGPLIELVKSNPELYAAVIRYLNETGLNITTRLPPRASPTEITVELNASEVVAGGAVAVRGVLTSRGKPVERQVVAIYLDNYLATAVTTDSRGEYRAVVRASVYKPNVVVKAVYIPPPGAPYKPSNASATLHVLYNETRLSLKAPTSVTWGENIVVEISQTPPVARRIVVALSNDTGVVYRTIANGTVAVIPTRGIAPGRYRLTASAPGAGPYAPASASTEVFVNAFKPEIVLKPPQLAIAGAPLDLRVETRPELKYQAYIGGQSVNGSLPLTVPTGYAKLAVRTAPSPPYAPAEATAQIFVVNPLQLAPLAAAPLAAAFARRALRKAPPVLEEVKAALPKKIMSLVEEETVAVLATAFQKLGNRAGLHYNRKMTFREYAKQVESHAADPKCLWYVVGLAERALFSPYNPSAAEINTAWLCVERL
ncbi:carboxypeptidase-like regulatory domain-containing protein [Pyrobaculum sp.]|uniref:carboxypeptidase-like regulatory domain-containing protein n=2 Tax=Pyrobaculum sp. TaxID=2004705 RepID=UPI00315FC9FF